MELIKHTIVLSLCISASTAFADNTKDSAPQKPIKDISHYANPVPKQLPLSKKGNPPFYEVDGKPYFVMKTNQGYHKVGFASWYGTKFHGKKTSSGERYNMYAMTAASPVLPIPSFAKVTNLENHKTIIVKVNDRGPFHDNRIMDLSYLAAAKLGMLTKGTAHVKVEAIDTGIKTLDLDTSYLQVAAFSNSQNAKSAVNKLKGLTDTPISIAANTETDKSLYRVLIGPIAYEDTKSIQQVLNKHGFNRSIVVSG